MKKLPIIFLLFLVGCAHFGTVKSKMDDPDFQLQNQPIRIVNIEVINDGFSKDAVLDSIMRVSDDLTKQVGITLSIKEYREGEISSFGHRQAVRNLSKNTFEPTKFDLIIGFSTRSIVSHLIEASSMGWAWLGVIDDTWRKFIVIKMLDDRVLLHEIYHAFIFNTVHSSSGIMSNAIVKVPLAPILFNLPHYISNKDREEVLRNKWRDFSERPEIPAEYRSDTLRK
jgi:hypothetical protein